MHAAELVALAALTARLSVEHARSRLDEVQTFSQIAELASVSLAIVYMAACFAVSPAEQPDWWWWWWWWWLFIQCPESGRKGRNEENMKD